MCAQAGIAPLELVRVAADVACRLSMYRTQFIVAASHPRVVEKTVEMALTDDGVEDRVTLHKATGFLPTPRGSQTVISMLQNAHANASAQPVTAPRPEEIIRRLSERFNQARGLPPALPTACRTVEVPLEDESDGQ